MDLIADIGATNSRCALIDEKGRITRAERFLNRRFGSLAELLRTFADGKDTHRAALAVAAPIAGDEVRMTNLDWIFSRQQLKRELGVETLCVLNDFEALARSLPRLQDRDCHRIGGGHAASRATRAVLGPGSGLGIAAIAPHDGDWTAVSGEGGHVTLPAQNDTEAFVIADHADTNGHCSAERLLSGPGLVRIYSSLAKRERLELDPVTPAEISEALARGEEHARRTYDVFFALLGTVAGNLALTVGARGGVYIAGGIVPRVIETLERSEFRERFVAKGRYRDYLEGIPTCVITAELPAFPGLKSVLGYG